jgi:predicted nucleotidyltransferase
MPATTCLINEQLENVRQLCRKHHVSRLELFGSAATGEFNPSRSDLDFLVDFKPLVPVDRADAYFGLLADLQDLFHRDIDLVETEAISNPYFKQTVNVDRTVLYAA